jgi:hypothetical protein
MAEEWSDDDVRVTRRIALKMIIAAQDGATTGTDLARMFMSAPNRIALVYVLARAVSEVGSTVAASAGLSPRAVSNLLRQLAEAADLGPDNRQN